MLSVGIDLGTVSACIAVARQEHAELIEISTGITDLPTVVSYASGKAQVGLPALGRCVTNPDATIRGIKRYIGLSAQDPAILRLMQRSAFGMSQSQGDMIQLKLGRAEVTPVDVTTEILGRLRELVELRTGDRVGLAVLAVPTTFDERRVEALKWAGFQAGLRDMVIVYEPVATVASLESPGPRRLVIVVDIGGGNTTVSVLHTGIGRETVLLESESEAVGADDVDDALISMAIERLDIPETDSSVYELLRQTCSKLKRDLCVTSSSTIQLPPMPFIQGDGTVRFSARDFKRALTDLLWTVNSACIRIRNAATGGPAVLGEAYLVGGITCVTNVQEAVSKALSTKLDTSLHRTGSVALGAARLAGIYAEHPERRPKLVLKPAPAPLPSAPSSQPQQPVVSPPPQRVSTSGPPSIGGKPQLTPEGGRLAIGAKPQLRPNIDSRSTTKAPISFGAIEAPTQSPLPRQSFSFENSVAEAPPLSPPPRKASRPIEPPSEPSPPPLSASPTFIAPPKAPQASSPDENFFGEEEDEVYDDDESFDEPREASIAIKFAPEIPTDHPTEQQPLTPPPTTPEPAAAAKAPPARTGQDETTREPPPARPSASRQPPPRPAPAPPSSAQSVGDVGHQSQMPWSSAARPETTSMLEKGRFRNPTTAVEMIKMPLTRALSQADLDPILLPVLLARVGLGLRLSGTLFLDREGQKPMVLPLEEGEAQITAAERNVLVQAFGLESGSFRFEKETKTASEKHGSFRMLPIIIEGLRNIMRSVSTDDMALALGRRMKQAPSVPPRQLRYIGVIGLTSLESRLIKFGLDGKRSAEELAEHGGVGKRTTLNVLLLMTVLDLVKWQEAEDKKEQSIADQLELRASEIKGADMFQRLSIHWTASREEVEAAYAKFLIDMGPGTYREKVAPEACRKILEAGKEAHDHLMDDHNRVAYRMKTHPDHDYDSLADFLEQKAKAVAMHSDSRPLGDVNQKLNEIQATRKKLGRRAKITKIP